MSSRPCEHRHESRNGPFAESLKKLMAIDRYGKGEEIAAFVAFLASAEAAYITGSSLTIDGGFGA